VIASPLQSTLFPSTTLFRSRYVDGSAALIGEIADRASRAELEHLPPVAVVGAEPGFSVFDDVRRAQAPQSRPQVLLTGLSRLVRSEEHMSELQSRENLVCRL